MTHGKPPLRNKKLDIVRQPQEPEEVRDGRSVLASAIANFFVTETEVASEAIKGLGRFDGIQVLALYVFDQRHFEDAVVGIVLNNGGNFGETSKVSGTEAALSSDEFVPFAFVTQNKRLNESVRLD